VAFERGTTGVVIERLGPSSIAFEFETSMNGLATERLYGSCETPLFDLFAAAATT
jgi:hypothetical protein